MLYPKAMRIMMFQLSGYHCKRSSRTRIPIVFLLTPPKFFDNKIKLYCNKIKLYYNTIKLFLL